MANYKLLNKARCLGNKIHNDITNLHKYTRLKSVCKGIAVLISVLHNNTSYYTYCKN